MRSSQRKQAKQPEHVVNSPASRPWLAIIDKIDHTLNAMRDNFEMAFAEGQIQPGPKELIKRGLFRDIWDKLVKGSTKFDNLQDLDAYYQRMHVNLSKYVGEYVLLPMVSELCLRHNLSDPVSERKIVMLQKIIALYHSLVRSGLILQNLHRSFSVEQCMDRLAFLEEKASLNQTLISQMDLENYHDHIINPLKVWNQHIVKVIHESGYGEIAASQLSNTAKRGRRNDAVLLPLGKQLEKLPHMADLVARVKGELNESTALRSYNLEANIREIQHIRQVFMQASDNILNEYFTRGNALATHYEGLQEIRKKTLFAEKLFPFFRTWLELEMTQEESEPPQDFPVLSKAAREAVAEAAAQSQLEKYRLVNNGWNDAGRQVYSDVLAIMSATREARASYDGCLQSFNHVCLMIKSKQGDEYAQVEALLKEWRGVHEEARRIAKDCDDKMAAVEKILTSASQTTGQYIGSFFQRHWWKMLIGAVGLAAPAVVLPMTVLSPMVMAVSVPAGVVIGGAGGAGVGMITDRQLPAVQAIDAEKLMFGDRQEVVDTNYIIERLFGTAETPVIHTDLDDAAPKAVMEASRSDLRESEVQLHQQIQRISSALQTDKSRETVVANHQEEVAPLSSSMPWAQSLPLISSVGSYPALFTQRVVATETQRDESKYINNL